ncbi:hypothetical protein WJX72_011556 [[Myrmecia] bisecta]|uniref:Cytochrome b561 domain-containing protein n=1 Tax=[Myrmecia] bisecta TaxID=41462 RepID=A0AAW1Q1Y4_9CHLO
MAEEVSDGQPVRLWIGPPGPAALTLLTRLLEVSTFVLVAIWTSSYLGGLGVSPTWTSTTVNDTNRVFNWHPLLMALAFPVFMAEALLAYRVPVVPSLERPQRKVLHGCLHAAALLCMVFAIIAAFQSHNLKEPKAIPNLYSAHSFMGMFTFVTSILQFLLGLYVFAWPKLAIKQRQAIAPLHTFLGKAVFVAGLATMAAGIQEKTTFLQMGKKLTGEALFGAEMRIPAALQLLLIFTGLLVLFHHQPPAANTTPRRPVREGDGSFLDDDSSAASSPGGRDEFDV